MAKIYGSDSLYVIGKKKFYDKRWFMFMAIFSTFLVIYAINLKSILELPLLIGYAIPIAFLVFMKFLGVFIDKNEIGSRKAKRGLGGEDEVFKILKDLPGLFSVFRGATIKGKYDIDFIVVGPTGVFTIEAKSHKGEIGLNENELTCNRYKFGEKNFLKQAISQALDVHEYIDSKISLDVFVTPAIVFTNAKVRFGMKPVNHVYVIQKQWLREFIIGKGDFPQYIEVEEVLKGLPQYQPTNDKKPA